MNPASTFFRSCRQRYPRSQLAYSKLPRGLQNARLLSNSSFCSSQLDSIPARASSRQSDVAAISFSTTPQSTFSSTGTNYSDLQASTASPVLETTGPSSPTTSPIDASALSAGDQDFIQNSFKKIGTVTRIGTMKQTVVVSHNRQQFDKFLKKHYNVAVKTFVHDPQDILAEGDVIAYGLFPPDQRVDRLKRGKKNIHFVVRDVITPFGLPLHQRTPRVTTPNPGKLSGRFAASGKQSGKQRRAGGVRGYATFPQEQIDRVQGKGMNVSRSGDGVKVQGSKLD